ncbi:hypothetical protein [Bradyrhizobium sp. Leo170]|uniref:hypothetical protein n=1 Tax=Bradyrhizobium sp. Leo170 TaxID=1571199 RepID=UPI00102EB124|nr:hypothetical protein [Bradyrhizobium sp. Leo170]TAI61106.1 hypothetical protein CWO89_37075 [Bradyrhizobium sp. Leo170]
MIDPGPAVGCLYCEPLLSELAELRARCESLERLVRVDSALARQLARSIAENVKLRARLIELGVRDL